MNQDIKSGAKLLLKGLWTEAAKAKETVKGKLDVNCDGRIDLIEIEEEVIRDAKEGAAKLKALAKDEKLSKKVKDEIDDALAKIKPVIEAVTDEESESKEAAEESVEETIED